MENNGHANGHANGSPARITSAFQSPNADRLPPQNIEAELSLIGSILWDNAELPRVVEIVRPIDFYRDTHQIVWNGVVELWSRGSAVDTVTLANHLEELGMFDRIGGIEFLAKATTIVPHAANAVYYAEIVKAKAKSRLAEEQAIEVIRRVRGQRHLADDVLDQMASAIDSMRPEEDEAIAAVPPPFKMADEAFHGLAGEIVEVIAPYTEACREALLIQFYAAFGNLIGRHAHCRVNATNHYTNLAVCIVAPTGCGKGTSWDAIKWSLSRCNESWQTIKTLSGLTSGEGLIEKIRDAGGTLLAVETEFGRFLSNMARQGNTLSDVFCQAWEGMALDVPTKQNSIRYETPHFTAIGHVTPSRLRAKVGREEIESGFVNRIAWIHAYLARLLPNGEDFDELTNLLNPYVQKLTFAAEFGRGHDVFKKPMKRLPRAEKLWNEVYESLRIRPETLHGTATARAAPYAMRFAMINAILDREFDVDLKHLTSALAIWDYSDQTAANLFGDPCQDRRFSKLYEALTKTEEGLTKTQIRRQVFRSHLTAIELDTLLSKAVASGHIVCHEKPSLGPKKHVYLLRRNLRKCAQPRTSALPAQDDESKHDASFE